MVEAGFGEAQGEAVETRIGVVESKIKHKHKDMQRLTVVERSLETVLQNISALDYV